ncbi:hypothetical protein BS47DRAFT_1029310 [Hydnum rufescens UP504]|uniref:Uncharacterized protein n=1 Tax=Hydnum rufescens UP504 TaxID=1448309 RepID=A0A9P6AW91_9AGAM|nr:hypothetical protein BS47DRAFT_1029310 [Hydnum rufescens UP504]
MPEDTNPSQETPGASNSGSRRGRPSQARNPNNRQSVHFVDPPRNPEPPSTVPSFGSQDPSQPSRLPSVLRPLTIPDPDPSASGVRQGPLNASNLPDLTFDATRNHPKAPAGEDLLHPIHTNAEHPSSVSVISSPVSTPIPPAVIFAQEERSYFNSDPSPSPISDQGNLDSQTNQPGDSSHLPRSGSPGDLPFSRRRGGGDPSDSRGAKIPAAAGLPLTSRPLITVPIPHPSIVLLTKFLRNTPINLHIINPVLLAHGPAAALASALALARSPALSLAHSMPSMDPNLALPRPSSCSSTQHAAA